MKFERVSSLFTARLDLLLSYPALIWQFYFLYAPLAVMLWVSFIDPETTQWTLVHYVNILKTIYIEIVLRSFFYATATSLLCLLLGYPLAYYLALKTTQYRLPLLFLLILPSWTNIIVQMYAWFFLLQKNGIFYKVLLFLRIIGPETRFLNTTGATILGLVYCFLPFMTLPLYAVLEKIDKRLLEASSDLGATKFQTFWRVIFPLSKPGMLAGLLLVFIPTFGEFAIPELLGGSKRLVWGTLIVNKFIIDRDFNAGAALTYVGLGFFIGLAFFIWFILRLIDLVQGIAHKRILLENKKNLLILKTSRKDRDSAGDLYGK
jgi:spermidine/putrescine transport system permease protein